MSIGSDIGDMFKDVYKTITAIVCSVNKIRDDFSGYKLERSEQQLKLVNTVDKLTDLVLIEQQKRIALEKQLKEMSGQ